MTNYPAVTSTDGFPQTAAYDQGSGAALPIAAGTVLTDANHNSQKSAEVLVQIADSAGTNVAGVDAHHSLKSSLIDSAGTNAAGVDAYHSIYVTDGGQNTTQVTASSAAAIKTAAGRLCKVIPTTTVTTAVNVYDNTNAASGTVLCAIPASAAIGTIYNVQTLAANGIYVGGASGSPQLTVSWD